MRRTPRHAPSVAGIRCASCARVPLLGLLLASCAAPGVDPDATLDGGPGDAGSAPRAGIAVYDGLGVWPEGLAALQGALQAADHDLHVVSAADLRAGALDGRAALVVSGGWAWDQWQGLGDDGVTAIRRFVLGGGGYLGICAGAYLASDDVVWEEAWVAYPLNLFNGTAEGPVPGLPTWPEAGTANVTRVDGEHPLQGTGALDVYYQGGGAFVPRDPGEVTPLQRYADGSLAALALEPGAGRVVLTGVHLEVATAVSGAVPVTADANRALLDAIVRWLARL